jgi:hypothetical protein
MFQVDSLALQLGALLLALIIIALSTRFKRLRDWIDENVTGRVNWDAVDKIYALNGGKFFKYLHNIFN